MTMMEGKYLHSFVMITVFVVAAAVAAAALPNGFQHTRNSLEHQRNLSNSYAKDFIFNATSSEDGDVDTEYVEEYIEDDPALPPPQPPPNIKKEKLLYTKEITIKQGRIKGIVRNFHPQTGLKDVHQYLGIPYAEAPVGSRRFMPPGEFNFLCLL